jgi:plasmid stabilization system protein ParE
MTYRLRYTQEAYDDVSRNAEWWARHHSVEQAQRWFAAIHAKIDTLKTSPELHALADENPDYPHELREALFGLGSRPSYRILFTVIDDEVIVLTIRAAEQDSIKPGDLPLPP